VALGCKLAYIGSWASPDPYQGSMTYMIGQPIIADNSPRSFVLPNISVFYSMLNQPFQGLVLSVAIVLAVVDTAVAATMLALLAPHRTRYSRYLFSSSHPVSLIYHAKSTRGIIHRLQILVINTSLFTALLSISTLAIVRRRLPPPAKSQCWHALLVRLSTG